MTATTAKTPPRPKAGKRRARGTARETAPVTEPAAAAARLEGAPPTEPRPTKLDLLIGLLSRADGASIAEMAEAAGWKSHSVRGALAGALRKKGHVVSSERVDGVRRYRIEAGA